MQHCYGFTFAKKCPSEVDAVETGLIKDPTPKRYKHEEMHQNFANPHKMAAARWHATQNAMSARKQPRQIASISYLQQYADILQNPCTITSQRHHESNLGTISQTTNPKHNCKESCREDWQINLKHPITFKPKDYMSNSNRHAEPTARPAQINQSLQKAMESVKSP